MEDVLPVTFKVPATLSVPVTELDAATNPPKNSTVVVVKLPRAVTDWRVSDKTVPEGHPTPDWRQTATPMTVAVEKVPILAVIWVPVAEAKERRPVEAKLVLVPLVSVVFWREVEPETVTVPRVTEAAESVFVLSEEPVALVNPRLVPKRFVLVVFVPVAFVQVRLVALNEAAVREEAIKFVISPLVAKRLVEVTEVPVAFVNVTPAREEGPVTERVPVAVRLKW